MVKITRVSNEVEQNKPQQPVEDQQKIIHINVSQRKARRRTTMPSLFKTDHSESEVPQKESGRETNFNSRDVKRQPIVRRLTINKDKKRIVPQNQQRIPSTTRESQVFDQFNSQMFDTSEEKLLQQKRNTFPKWLFYLMAGLILLGIGAIVAAVVVTTLNSSGIPKTNWLLNGDAESGSCEAGSGFTHPTYWNYNGTITPIYYSNTNGSLMYTDPGPSDRGNCYFYGQQSAITSMWQIINLPDSINPSLMDNQKLWYNLSAWMGGVAGQDDNAQVSLTFLSQSNQQVGNTVTIGPVLAAERGSITSLIFHEANALVPSGTRSFMVMVTITLSSGAYNDGLIDNIALYLYNQ